MTSGLGHSPAGHNPAAYDPAVIYWDWESTKTLTRPPPGLEHPSKALKYPPGLGPTEQSPWDKPYFQRPGSRSRAGTLRRADALIGDPKSQPSINLEKIASPIENCRDKQILSETMLTFPETLHSEVKRKVFEGMGNRFIESLQKLDKSGTGKITDFSPILENHWNELAEFYSTMVSAARMLKKEVSLTPLAVRKDSSETPQPSPGRSFSPLDELIAKEAFNYPTPIGGSKKTTHPTSSAPRQWVTYHPIEEGAGGLRQEANQALGTLDQFDDTKQVFSKTEKSPDVRVDKIASITSTMNTSFESKLSEAIKGVRIDLKPLEATWSESQTEIHGDSGVIPRNTEESALHADTQIELEMQEMIQQENSRAFAKNIRSQESNATSINTAQHKDIGSHEETKQDIKRADVYMSDHSGTETKTLIECMRPKDTCTGSADDISFKAIDIKADIDGSRYKEREFIFEAFGPEICPVAKNGEDVQEPCLSMAQLKTIEKDIDESGLGYTDSNLARNENISFDRDCIDVSSGADSSSNDVCDSTPEEITPGEVNHPAAITDDLINTPINKNEGSLGLNEIESNDSFSISAESSIFPGSTQDELEKLQMEVTNHLEKAKADGGSFTARWIDQFGVQREKRCEIILKPDIEVDTDQNGEDKHAASVYYDVEVTSSEYEYGTIDEMEEILAPMNESYIEGSETNESAKRDVYDLENKTGTSANSEEAYCKENSEESEESKEIGEGIDSLGLLEQTVAEPVKELGAVKEEDDGQDDQGENLEDLEDENDKNQTGSRPEWTIISTKEMEIDGEGDGTGETNVEELGADEL